MTKSSAYADSGIMPTGWWTCWSGRCHPVRARH